MTCGVSAMFIANFTNVDSCQFGINLSTLRRVEAYVGCIENYGWRKSSAPPQTKSLTIKYLTNFFKKKKGLKKTDPAELVSWSKDQNPLHFSRTSNICFVLFSSKISNDYVLHIFCIWMCFYRVRIQNDMKLCYFTLILDKHLKLHLTFVSFYH